MKWLAGPLSAAVAREISRHREQGDLPLFLVKAVAFLVVAGLLSYAVERFCEKRGWTGEKTKASLRRLWSKGPGSGKSERSDGSGSNNGERQ